ncbi:MAG: hypothetical protein ACO225_01300 [Ilumatobacteraceae bacterium]
MTRDVQPDEEDVLRPGTPAGELLAATQRRAREWLTAGLVRAARRSGLRLEADDEDLAQVVDEAVQRLVADLAVLLGTDVDAQRMNPLALFRAAVIDPNRWLLERGARPTDADRFVTDRFPDDAFGLGPATWSDVHADLHEPGIAWGAWKAMTVLRRRQDEGRR